MFLFEHLKALLGKYELKLNIQCSPDIWIKGPALNSTEPEESMWRLFS